MSTDSMQRLQADGTQFRVRKCPPPAPQTIDWFMVSVRPALKQLANSWMMNYRLLHEAAETLPLAEQSAWRDLVRQLEITVAKAFGFGRSSSRPLPVRFFMEAWAVIRWIIFRGKDKTWEDLQGLFRRLIGDLNANWFISRSLFLYPYAEAQLCLVPESRLWETSSIALAEIKYEAFYPFADGIIPLYTVRHILPMPTPSSRQPCFYDNLLRMVMVDNNYINRLMHEVKLGARGDNIIDAYLRLLGCFDPNAPSIERQYCQRLDQNFPKTQDLCFNYMSRAVTEELRHGMDAIRVDSCYTNREEHYRQLGETLLAWNGRVRQLFWEMAQTSRGAELLYGEDVELGQVISELSGQMTAAAITHPGLVLMEWWRKLAILANHASDPRLQLFHLNHYIEHTLAGILGTILLGECLNCGPPLSWSMLCKPDFAELADIAWEVMNRPLAEMRLALKTVYQNEFNYPIDEAPFAEILPNGELRNRGQGESEKAQTEEL